MAIQIPSETQQQWTGWVQTTIAAPFRKRALKAALGSLASGGTSDQAMVAAKEAREVERTIWQRLPWSLVLLAQRWACFSVAYRFSPHCSRSLQLRKDTVRSTERGKRGPASL